MRKGAVGVVLALSASLMGCGDGRDRDRGGELSGGFSSGFSGSLVGPGGAEDYCNALCSCSACGEGGAADCIDQMNQLSGAYSSGCSGLITEYFTCAAETGQCVSGNLVTTQCDSESSRLDDCISGGGTDDGGD